MTSVSEILDLVTVPEGKSGKVKIERFEIKEEDRSRGFFQYGARAPQPGTYTRLMRSGRLWMSDTYAERSDHWEAVTKMLHLDEPGRVLIGGLGIGMVVQAALRCPNVTHVDVVEIDEDVIALVGPHYEKMAEDAGKTIRIVHGSVFDRKKLFTREDRWAVAWMDIWEELSMDNLPDMAKLSRTYTRFADWIGHWGREIVRYQVRRERQYAHWY